MHQEFDHKLKGLEGSYNSYVEEVCRQKNAEICAMKTKNNKELNQLKKDHDAALQELKQRYCETTSSNLELIHILKNKVNGTRLSCLFHLGIQEQLQEVRVEKDECEKRMSEVMLENKRVLEELNELQNKLLHSEKEKNLLVTTQSTLKLKEKKLKDLQWVYDMLQKKFNQVQGEKNRQEERFSAAILTMQTATHRNLLPEQKLLEKDQVVASSVNPRTLSMVNQCQDVQIFDQEAREGSEDVGNEMAEALKECFIVEKKSDQNTDPAKV
ncbi:dynein regulatory complex subunit 4-like [Sceloporus undulatus]|uniref:dynein regulatory complex subunit 4-like n=1 Tax=Sceloporus undulatus TaxID=8520 RepID=UPI001C4ABC29|nr:dynein regulatory complex subunit 4-like [Sceloporus undulatus]